MEVNDTTMKERYQMTNNKKRANHNNGSQKGNTNNEAINTENVLSQEELEKAISPTGRQNSKQ